MYMLPHLQQFVAHTLNCIIGSVITWITAMTNFKVFFVSVQNSYIL